mmetsp:Transcript_15184/g.34987  ORF Transcript_15184/g.34987 Transcript_15184/m.34987 type:complete len:97 (+) Transcript_15184:1036-1326(+)
MMGMSMMPAGGGFCPSKQQGMQVNQKQKERKSSKASQPACQTVSQSVNRKHFHWFWPQTAIFVLLCANGIHYQQDRNDPFFAKELDWIAKGKHRLY